MRISGYRTGEPYFGTSGANRFDAPGCAHGHAEFATCYFGTSLEVALTESILHDAVPTGGLFRLVSAHFQGRYGLYFEGAPLHLLDLTGAQLKRFGGTADLAGTSDYAVTRQWAFAVFRNPAHFDGFCYMSRHYNIGRAVALFDRARRKVSLAAYAPVTSAPGFARAQKKLGILFE